MGSLSAAWHLSTPGWERDFESITVYQRGWRLGGKGASGRGRDCRVEEHGLHVLLGYYHNSFGLLDDVYRFIDRHATAPDCPIRSLEEMLIASPRVGVTDLHRGEWETWTAHFGPAEQPTVPIQPDQPLTIVELVRRSLQLLVDFAASTITAAPDTDLRPMVSLDLHPDDSSHATLPGAVDRAETILERGVRSALAVALEAVVALQVQGRRWFPEGHPALALITTGLEVARQRLHRLVAPDPASRHWFQLADTVLTIIRGLADEGVLTAPGRLRALDDHDFRAWLTHHGADPLTVESPLIRGVYDLAFAYEGGDSERPAFPAGLGIYLSGRMFFDYQGSIFWKMRCGMGDAVFAPMYEGLVARGVRVEFFHTLENLQLGEGRLVDGIELSKQTDLAPGVEDYQPLVDVDGLPSWPAEPLTDQLAAPLGADSEYLWADPPGPMPVALRRGADFDIAILGVSLGMVPYVAGELVQSNQRWRAMVDHVGTVPTQALQLWLSPTQQELGFEHDDVTISGFVEPFDTWAAMNHILEFESWPDDGPQTLAYFCNALQTHQPPDVAGQAAALEQVRLNSVHFLDHHVRQFWPLATDIFPDRFRWSTLYVGESEAVGPDRLQEQYMRANLDPSDQYVQALPGTAMFRMRTDETGYDNLLVTGDWIDTGLNAGCLEAAVMAGMQTANALLPPHRRVEIAALKELREYFG